MNHNRPEEARFMNAQSHLDQKGPGYYLILLRNEFRRQQRGKSFSSTEGTQTRDLYQHWIKKHFGITENLGDFRVRMVHDVVILLEHLEQLRGYVFSEKIAMRLPGEPPLPAEDYVTLAHSVKIEYERIPQRTISGFFVDEGEKLAGFSWRDNE